MMITRHGGGEEEPPSEPIFLGANLTRFLSGAWYAISISIVMLGVVIWLQNQYNDLRTMQRDLIDVRMEMRQRDLDMKKQLDDHTKAFDQRFTDLDVHGTRALTERMNNVENENRQQNDRILEIIRTLHDDEAKFADLPLIRERQNQNTQKLDRLYEMLTAKRPTDAGPTGQH